MKTYYAIFACDRKKNRAIDKPCLDPLSYGKDDEPSPEYLLRRGRVELFASNKEADSAFSVSAKRMADCDPLAFKNFQKSFSFLVLECNFQE
jgi:hypothetical protein